MKWDKLNTVRQQSADGRFEIHKRYAYSGGTSLIDYNRQYYCKTNRQTFHWVILCDNVKEAKAIAERIANGEAIESYMDRSEYFESLN